MNALKMFILFENGDISSSYISLWKGSDSIVVFEVFWLQFGVTV